MLHSQQSPLVSTKIVTINLSVDFHIFTGPKINVSATSLYFYNCIKAKKRKNILELRNTSEVDTVFQFDVNEGQQDTFIVKPTKGYIQANKYVFIEIVYAPKVPGQHFDKLHCLIEYHVRLLQTKRNHFVYYAKVL